MSPSRDASSGGTLGVVAGDGTLPLAMTRAAAERGRRVVAVAFPGITSSEIDALAGEVAWLDPGQVDAALAFLRQGGAREAVLAGKVSKQHLVGGKLDLDERARRILGRLQDWNDGTLLAALASEIESEGIRLLPQPELVPELLAGTGPVGRVHPTPLQLEQIALGWPVARTIASLDIGQTVVVHERSIVAIEAIEGTDEAIRRAGRLGGPGGCIVKVANPHQDPRFDLPAIGPRTVAVAVEAGAKVIAVEASRSLVLERKQVALQADEAGMAVVGVPEGGPDPGSGGSH